MSKLNKKILFICMLLPMLVMICHDMLPHHKHTDNAQQDNIHAFHCSDHSHENIEFDSETEKKQHSCCYTSHSRISVKSCFNYIAYKANIKYIFYAAPKEIIHIPLVASKILTRILKSHNKRGPPNS